MDKELTKITLGNIVTTATSDQPVIDVLIDNKFKGYLSAFRGYKYQVSETIWGDNDLASSSLIPIIKYAEDRDILVTHAEMALVRFSNRMNDFKGASLLSIADQVKLREFVDRTVEWVLTNGVDPYGVNK